MRPVAKWGDIGFANVAFGQGLTVTPLQMVAGVSAIAGGGIYRQPRIVARVVQADGTHRDAAGRARAARDGAGRGTNHAFDHAWRDRTGRNSEAGRDRRLRRGAARPGTAQKVANGHYDPSKWVSSFVGVVPAEDPRLVIMVIVDEPQGGHLGGAVAAPIFKEIAEQALRYLHVPPTHGRSRRRRGQAGGGGEAGRGGRRRAAVADADDGGDEAPATDLPLDDDALGDDPALAEKWDEVAGAEGGRAERPPAERVVVPGLRGAEPRAGDPRRAQERRRAGLRRSGRARDRRGAAPAAGARPGTAGCGLPRGVRAQGMTSRASRSRGLLEGIDGARVHGDADVAVARGARRFAAGRARRPVRRGARARRSTGAGSSATRSGAARRRWSIEGEPPAELAFPGAGARSSERAARAGRHRAQPLSRRGGLELSAVTGTNGKTTTTYIVEAMLRAAGLSPGVVGTVSYRGPGVPGGARPAPNTTPGALMLHELFAEMRAGGGDRRRVRSDFARARAGAG